MKFRARCELSRNIIYHTDGAAHEVVPAIPQGVLAAPDGRIETTASITSNLWIAIPVEAGPMIHCIDTPDLHGSRNPAQDWPQYRVLVGATHDHIEAVISEFHFDPEPEFPWPLANIKKRTSGFGSRAEECYRRFEIRA